MAYVYKNPHEQSYRAAHLEKANLEQERQALVQRAAWIEQRLAQLDAFLLAISPLMREDPGGEVAKEGLTHVCRQLLENEQRWMAAGEVRAMLYQRGIDIKPYANPMAVLHSVLGRVGKKQRAADGT